MNRENYMEALINALQEFNQDIRDEIIADYEEHFIIGKMEGKSEERIAAELGNIADLVTELRNLSKENEERGLEVVPIKDWYNEKGCKDEDNKEGKKEDGFSFDKEGFEKFFNKDFYENVGSKLGEAFTKLGVATEIGIKKASVAAKEVAKVASSEYKKASSELKNKMTAEETVTLITTLKKLETNFNMTDVCFKPSDSDEITYTVKMAGTPNQLLNYKVVAEENEDSLVFSLRKNSTESNFFQVMVEPIVSVCIDVPKNIEEIKVITISGDTSISDLENVSVNISTTSGEVSVQNVKGKSFSFKTSSGDLSLNNSEIDEVHFMSASGDLSMDGVNAKEMNYETSSGDLCIFKTCANSLKAKAASGDQDISKSMIKDIALKNISGDTSIKFDSIGGFDANVNTVSGDMCISFGKENHNGIKSGRYSFGNPEVFVQVDNVSGDCTITC